MRRLLLTTGRLAETVYKRGTRKIQKFTCALLWDIQEHIQIWNCSSDQKDSNNALGDVGLAEVCIAFHMHVTPCEYSLVTLNSCSSIIRVWNPALWSLSSSDDHSIHRSFNLLNTSLHNLHFLLHVLTQACTSTRRRI